MFIFDVIRATNKTTSSHLNEFTSSIPPNLLKQYYTTDVSQNFYNFFQMFMNKYVSKDLLMVATEA